MVQWLIRLVAGLLFMSLFYDEPSLLPINS